MTTVSRKSDEQYKVVNSIINTLRSGDCVAYVSTGNGGAGFGIWSPSDEDMELRNHLLHFSRVDEVDAEDDEELCADWKDYDQFDASFDFYELTEEGSDNPFRIQVMINPDMYVNSHELRDMITDDQDGLTGEEITSGINGYPSHLRGAVVGFASYKQAEQIANLYGVEVVSLRRRDGWQFYESLGRAYEDYDMMDVYDCDCNYSIYADADEFVATIDEVMNEADEDDFDGDYSDFMARMQSLKDRVMDEDTDGRFFLVPCDDWDAYELIDRKAASYSYDVWTYDIALDCSVID